MEVLTPGPRTRPSALRATPLRRAFGVLAAVGLCLAATPLTPAAALGAADGTVLASSSECTFGGSVVSSTPWSLQRVLLNQLWDASTGKGVTVGVIDTGVDKTNP